MLELPRRRFMAGLIGLIAAPAIVRATSLMPVKVLAEDSPYLITSVDWDDIVTTTLRYRSKMLADNISNNNALLRMLREGRPEDLPLQA